MNNTQDQFSAFLEDAKNDPNVIALWLGGSRGKGLVTEHSDYDTVVIVKDEIFDEYKKKYKELEDDNFEFFVKTLQMFRDHAEWGTKNAWDRYNFTHVQPLIDKTDGEIKKLFTEKSVIPQDKLKEFVSENLDGYINQVYRSLKCSRDGNLLASRLEAAESIPFLLNSVFGLEGRLKPYYKYIQWELIKYPISKLPWTGDVFLEKIISILTTADIFTQQEILKVIESIFRLEGYGDVFDAWGVKLDLMKNYKK